MTDTTTLVCILAVMGAMLAGCSPAVAQQPRVFNLDTLSDAQRDAAAALDVIVSGPINATADTFKSASEKQTKIDELVRMYSGQIRYRLATLYYPVDLAGAQAETNDPRLAEQVRLFESTLNPDNPAVKTDGVLSYFEYGELARLARVENLIQVQLGGGKEIWVSQSRVGTERFARAEGTWALEGEEIAFPVNIAKIECRSWDQACVVLDLSILLDELNSDWGASVYDPPLRPSDYHATTDETTFEITRWTANVIEARADMGGMMTPGCRFSILSMNFDTKSVSQITQDGDKPCETFGQPAPRLGRPRISTLGSTEAALNAYYHKRFDEVEKHYGPLAKQFSWERAYIIGD